MNDEEFSVLKGYTIAGVISATIWGVIICSIFGIRGCTEASATEIPVKLAERAVLGTFFVPHSLDQQNALADAIWHAEGGNKTNYPYGIRSMNCDTVAECRRVCLNTIKNNVGRYETDAKGAKNYLEFLARRYSPIGARNDPESLNRHWLSNVKWFLAHPKDIPS